MARIESVKFLKKEKAVYSKAIAGAASLLIKFSSMANQEGKPWISNVSTQSVGQLEISGFVAFKEADGNEIKIVLNQYIPARNLKTGIVSKAEAGNVLNWYAASCIPGVKEGELSQTQRSETLRLMAFFILSAMKGRLPSENAISVESSMKAYTAKLLLQETKCTILEAQIKEDKVKTFSKTGESVLGLINFWSEQFSSILESSNIKSGRGRTLPSEVKVELL